MTTPPLAPTPAAAGRLFIPVFVFALVMIVTAGLLMILGEAWRDDGPAAPTCLPGRALVWVDPSGKASPYAMCAATLERPR